MRVATDAKMIQRRVVREEMTKILVVEGRESKCPRFSQVRVLAFFNPIPSGPQHPRALQRKLLGNEEYCLQIDAHSSFIHHWDLIAKEEWKETHNEFAILSTSPAAMSERDDYESKTGSKHGQVPRICKVRIADNSLPVRHDVRFDRSN
jgi:Glycosyltransferase (GlcNAc)